jgi:lysozyme
MTNLEEMLIRHEGSGLKPYRCTSGKLTIGVGRNLEDKGITEEEAMYLLRNDIKECRADLKELFRDQFYILSQNRQDALMNMRFNLGARGFRGFERMIAAIRRSDFRLAAREMWLSEWSKQVGGRVVELARKMREG